MIGFFCCEIEKILGSCFFLVESGEGLYLGILEIVEEGMADL